MTRVFGLSETCRLPLRSEEHTSELQSPIDISYAVLCLKKKKRRGGQRTTPHERDRAEGRFSRPFDARGRRRGVPVAVPAFARFFFFNDTATTEIYTSIDTLSLHDALPISAAVSDVAAPAQPTAAPTLA